MPFDTKNDGGPAYPSKFEVTGGSFDPIKGRDVPVGHTEQYIQLGMSLRDYFAAKAMQAIMTAKYDDYASFAGGKAAISASAYYMADAMLAARQQPTK